MCFRFSDGLMIQHIRSDVFPALRENINGPLARSSCLFPLSGFHSYRTPRRFSIHPLTTTGDCIYQ